MRVLLALTEEEVTLRYLMCSGCWGLRVFGLEGRMSMKGSGGAGAD